MSIRSTLCADDFIIFVPRLKTPNWTENSLRMYSITHIQHQALQNGVKFSKTKLLPYIYYSFNFQIQCSLRSVPDSVKYLILIFEQKLKQIAYVHNLMIVILFKKNESVEVSDHKSFTLHILHLHQIKMQLRGFTLRQP